MFKTCLQATGCSGVQTGYIMSVGYMSPEHGNQTGFLRNNYGITSRPGQRKRKEAARKCLMESLHTRFNDVKHSGHVFIGDISKHETKLPRVLARGTDSQQSNCKHSIGNSSPSLANPNSILDIVDETKNTEHLQHATTVRKTNSNNLSLPEIIMEFNFETSMATSDGHNLMTSPTDFTEDDRVLGAPYEDYLTNKKYGRYNPCKGKYRPVTPGLLESLNKQRMPSKVKTEQWLRSTQYLPKATNFSVQYQPQGGQSASPGYPSWIYTDSST